MIFEFIILQFIFTEQPLIIIHSINNVSDCHMFFSNWLQKKICVLFIQLFNLIIVFESYKTHIRMNSDTKNDIIHA